MHQLSYNNESSAYPSFAPVFSNYEKYLPLMGLEDPKVAAALNELKECVSSSPDPVKELKALLDETNWRCHIVAVVSLGFLADRSSMVEDLWAVLDRGTWASPQLVSVLSIYDDHFVNNALTKIDEYSRIEKPSFFSGFFRAKKNASNELDYSVACKTVSAIYSILSQCKNAIQNERFKNTRAERMIKEDSDRGGQIAIDWVENYKRLLPELK